MRIIAPKKSFGLRIHETKSRLRQLNRLKSFYCLLIIILIASIHIIIRSYSSTGPFMGKDESTTIFPAINVARNIYYGNGSLKYIYHQIFGAQFFRQGLQIGIASFFYIVIEFLHIPFTELILRLPACFAGWICTISVGLLAWIISGRKAGVFAALMYILVPNTILNHCIIRANNTFTPVVQVLSVFSIICYAKSLHKRWIWIFWFLVAYQVGDDNGFFVSFILYAIFIISVWKIENNIACKGYLHAIIKYLFHPGILMVLIIIVLRWGLLSNNFNSEFFQIIVDKCKEGVSLGFKRIIIANLQILGYVIGIAVMISPFVFIFKKTTVQSKWAFLLIIWIFIFEFPVFILNSYEHLPLTPLLYIAAPAAVIITLLLSILKLNKYIYVAIFIVLAIIPAALQHRDLIDTVINEKHSTTVCSIRAQGYIFRQLLKKGVSPEKILFPFEAAFVYTGDFYIGVWEPTIGKSYFFNENAEICFVPQNLLKRKVMGKYLSEAIDDFIENNELKSVYRILDAEGKTSCKIYSSKELFPKEVIGEEKKLANLFIDEYADLRGLAFTRKLK